MQTDNNRHLQTGKEDHHMKSLLLNKTQQVILVRMLQLALNVNILT